MIAAAALVLLLPRLQEAADPDGLAFFESRIRPVLAERCYSCHAKEAPKLKGNLLLDSRAGVLKGGDLGPSVIPGDPDRSLLIQAVRWSHDELKMPPKKRLPAAELADLEAWVRRGAPLPPDRAVLQADSAAAKKHWAFQPVGRPAPPAVRNEGWVRNEVDRFILAKLEEKQLAPSPPADPRTLLRRAAYDLTGLPPSPEELAAFVADSSPAAWDRAVERLLASPRYGERWGRHWLDVARYADTKGYVYAGRDEARFVHAWAYRDWVVRAFNEDLPYDRFLQLQLAADRLAEDKRDLAAMGFLTVGRRFINNPHDIIDDRIDTVGRGMMALTLSCARCHDHKFDPVPTDDYYSLYGVFASCAEAQKPIGPLGDGPFAAELRKREDALQALFERKRKELLDRIRSQAELYFTAAATAEKLPTEEFYQLLDPNEVNPVFARAWQQFLYGTRDGFHPLFAPWHALQGIPERDLPARAPAWLETQRAKLNPRIHEALAAGGAPGSFAEVAARFGRAFAAVVKKVKAGTPRDAAEQELEAVLYGADSPLAFPPGAINEVEWFFDEGSRVELGKAQLAIDQWILDSPGSPPYAAVLEDRAIPMKPRVFRRGNPANKGAEVPRQYLGFLETDRKPFTDGSGRLELARKIASAGNPLTARVWVNRIWQHHFGRGLVATPSDFGLRSDAPSHPELLDHLARRLVEGGWSTKALHRLILNSAAWRQASDDVPAARAADPENRLLWRMNRRRLDWESLRDSVLLAAGRLDPSLGGKPDAFTGVRRSLYSFVDRLNVPGTLRAFDFTNVDVSTAQRHVTTVPQQALFLMNSPFLVEQAKALAKRAGSDPVGFLYRELFLRAPTAAEAEAGAKWLGQPAPPPREWKPGPWAYGSGDPASFTPLPYFNGTAWQGGPAWPDAALGWARLDASGGHPGENPKHAVIRRWTAPDDLTVSIAGRIQHQPPQGNGIRARIVSSRSGELGAWTLHHLEAEAAFKGLEVKKGETLDFVVDFRGEISYDQFLWAPVIGAKGREWNAAKDFAGPPALPLGALERYAQTLLMTNEFLFLD